MIVASMILGVLIAAVGIFIAIADNLWDANKRQFTAEGKELVGLFVFLTAIHTAIVAYGQHEQQKLITSIGATSEKLEDNLTIQKLRASQARQAQMIGFVASLADISEKHWTDVFNKHLSDLETEDWQEDVADSMDLILQEVQSLEEGFDVLEEFVKANKKGWTEGFIKQAKGKHVISDFAKMLRVHSVPLADRADLIARIANYARQLTSIAKASLLAGHTHLALESRKQEIDLENSKNILMSKESTK